MKTRRTPEQLISDLEAKIADVKARAARRQARANPVVRHALVAARALDRALAEVAEATTKEALQAARTALGAVEGVLPPTAAQPGRVPRPRARKQEAELQPQ